MLFPALTPTTKELAVHLPASCRPFTRPYTCNKFLHAAVLSGIFGMHKFCTGRVWTGILYVLFSRAGIPTVAGIVEGVPAAFKPTDALGVIVV